MVEIKTILLFIWSLALIPFIIYWISLILKRNNTYGPRNKDGGSQHAKRIGRNKLGKYT